MISLIVFMYNEQKYIIETLESIKYQVQKYGADKEIQLIITDDHSQDNTVKLAEIWLEQNKALFTEVTRLYGEKNVGTCKKYGEAIKHINGTQYMEISGDDIFSSSNLFDKLIRAQKYDIMMNAVLPFDENGISFSKKDYSNIVLQCLWDTKNLCFNSKLGSPVLNGVIISIEKMDKNIIEYMEKYTLVEDRPRTYKIAMENKDITISYENVPILLSRRHASSASNISSPYLTIHNKDLDDLFSDIIKNEHNFMVNFFAKWQKKSIHMRGKKSLASVLRYFTPYYFYLAFKIFLNHKTISSLKSELIDTYAKENNDHLIYIKEQARQFYQDNNIQI